MVDSATLQAFRGDRRHAFSPSARSKLETNKTVNAKIWVGTSVEEPRSRK